MFRNTIHQRCLEGGLIILYESIYKYAREHNLTSVRNRAMRICTAYICISEEGVYDRLDVVPKEYRVKRMYPDIGKNRAASGTNANMICMSSGRLDEARFVTLF